VAAEPTRLRVLTYNVRSLRDDPAAVAHVVRSVDPDVVCVQEAPRFLRWRAKIAALARESGLVFVTGGRPAGAVALLAHLRVDVHDARDGLLTKRPRLEQRGLAGAVVSKAGARLVVASAHLGLDAAERPTHAGEVLELLGQLGAGPVVLAGDLNELPGDPAWQVLHAGGLRDPAPGSGPTFPARAPRKRIDAVLVSDGVEVVDYRVVDEPGVERASDHRPVLADLTLPTPR
jgi:endonuclease/exonuclease/phosphatase family metal-dependent hydrolase